MAKPKSLLTFEWKTDTLSPLLRQLPTGANAVVREAVQEITLRANRKIRLRTPVDRGVKGGLISRWRRRFRKGGLEGVISNDAPHANVAEFGGWPVRPARRGAGPGFKRGKAVLGGLPPGKRTRRAPGGQPSMRSNVSKQAPQGMVRITLQELEQPFVRLVEEKLDRFFGRFP